MKKSNKNRKKRKTRDSEKKQQFKQKIKDFVFSSVFLNSFRSIPLKNLLIIFIDLSAIVLVLLSLFISNLIIFSNLKDSDELFSLMQKISMGSQNNQDILNSIGEQEISVLAGIKKDILPPFIISLVLFVVLFYIILSLNSTLNYSLLSKNKFSLKNFFHNLLFNSLYLTILVASTFFIFKKVRIPLNIHLVWVILAIFVLLFPVFHSVIAINKEHSNKKPPKKTKSFILIFLEKMKDSFAVIGFYPHFYLLTFVLSIFIFIVLKIILEVLMLFLSFLAVPLSILMILVWLLLTRRYVFNLTKKQLLILHS